MILGLAVIVALGFVLHSIVLPIVLIVVTTGAILLFRKLVGKAFRGRFG